MLSLKYHVISWYMKYQTVLSDATLRHNNSGCHLYVADNSYQDLISAYKSYLIPSSHLYEITLSFDLNTDLLCVLCVCVLCVCVCVWCVCVVCVCVCVCVHAGTVQMAVTRFSFLCSGTHCVLPVQCPLTAATQNWSHHRWCHTWDRFFHVWGQVTHGVFLGQSGHPLKSCFMSLAQTACAGSCTDLVPNWIWVEINILNGQYSQYYSGI